MNLGLLALPFFAILSYVFSSKFLMFYQKDISDTETIQKEYKKGLILTLVVSLANLLSMLALLAIISPLDTSFDIQNIKMIKENTVLLSALIIYLLSAVSIIILFPINLIRLISSMSFFVIYDFRYKTETITRSKNKRITHILGYLLSMLAFTLILYDVFSYLLAIQTSKAYTSSFPLIPWALTFLLISFLLTRKSKVLRVSYK